MSLGVGAPAAAQQVIAIIAGVGRLVVVEEGIIRRELVIGAVPRQRIGLLIYRPADRQVAGGRAEEVARLDEHIYRLAAQRFFLHRGNRHLEFGRAVFGNRELSGAEVDEVPGVQVDAIETQVGVGRQGKLPVKGAEFVKGQFFFIAQIFGGLKEGRVLHFHGHVFTGRQVVAPIVCLTQDALEVDCVAGAIDGPVCIDIGKLRRFQRTGVIEVVLPGADPCIPLRVGDPKTALSRIVAHHGHVHHVRFDRLIGEAGQAVRIRGRGPDFCAEIIVQGQIAPGSRQTGFQFSRPDAHFIRHLLDDQVGVAHDEHHLLPLPVDAVRVYFRRADLQEIDTGWQYAAVRQ